MIAMSPRQWADAIARKVSVGFESNMLIDEKALSDMFLSYVLQITAGENKSILDELTNLACKETDPGKRSVYLRIARMIQNRLPNTEVQRPPVEPSVTT